MRKKERRLKPAATRTPDIFVRIILNHGFRQVGAGLKPALTGLLGGFAV
jgi:hypothetical protein